jgi:outer membrane immunogenic protein
MKKVVLTAASLAVMTSSALAADLPSKKDPIDVPTPPKNWTGFYAGLNAGATWGNSNSIQFSSIPTYSNPALPTAPYQAAIASIFGTTRLPTTTSASFLAGGQLGYNHQISTNIVIGIETDIQGVAGQEDQSSNYYGAITYNTRAASSGLQIPTSLYTTASASKSLDYLGTFRGRIGFLATPDLLMYGTGGFAYGRVNLNSFAWQEVSSASTDEIGPGKSRYTGTNIGWTAGGGLEWMLAQNWSVKFEYLYYNLGSINLYGGQMIRIWNGHSTVAGISAGDFSHITNSWSHTNFNGNIVRAGVNYHFNLGAMPVVAKF